MKYNPRTAVASSDYVFLFWIHLPGFRIPYVLLVRVLLAFVLTVFLSANLVLSMRYSRMLEESSFANRKADYFWLLLLSSIMLLVCVLCRLQQVLILPPYRHCPPWLTFRSSPPLWPLSPYTCGHGAIHLPRYLSSGSSQLLHRIFRWHL